MLKKTLPANHVDIALEIAKLAKLYRVEGIFELALKKSIEALDIFRQNPAENQHISNSLNNIGGIYNSLCKYDLAAENLKESLVFLKKVQPADNVMIGDVLSNLGSIYDAQGKHNLALKFYNEALDLKSKAVPLDKVSMAKTLANIGVCYK